MFALDLHISTFCIVYGMILLLEYLIWRKKERKIRFLGLAVFTLYLLLLFKVTICPIIFLRPENRQEFLKAAGSSVHYYQLIPLKTIRNTIQADTWMLQIFGNIILLSPIPFFQAFLSGKKPQFRVSVLMGFGISLAIEMIQLVIDIAGVFPSHAVDVDDVILNVLGVILGTCIVSLLYHTEFFRKISLLFRREQ